MIKYFSKGFVKDQILKQPISLKEISSTNHWENEISNNDITLNNILNEICATIKKYCNINEKNIEAKFIGHSLILMQVKGLPENLTCHQIINDIWNDKYQPCKADNEIKNLLNGIQKFDLQVTEVVHERSIRAKVFFRKNYER